MHPDVRRCRVGGEDSYGLLTPARLILTTLRYRRARGSGWASARGQSAVRSRRRPARRWADGRNFGLESGYRSRCDPSSCGTQPGRISRDTAVASNDRHTAGPGTTKAAPARQYPAAPCLIVVLMLGGRCSSCAFAAANACVYHSGGQWPRRHATARPRSRRSGTGPAGSRCR